MRFRLCLICVCVALLGVFPFTIAQESEGLEHPVVKPYPGSSLNERFSKREDFSTKDFRLKVDNRNTKVEKGGQYWKLVYKILDASGAPDPNVSGSEVLNNYRKAAEEKGGTVHNLGSNYIVFSVPRAEGGDSWVHLTTASGGYTMEIVDEEGMVQKLSFGAEEMKKALDADGHIAIHGINFEVGKADLQMGAENIIGEIVKLMKLYPDLRIEIQGHTDNTGSAESNLQLSDARAETVKKFILLFGVESSRLVSKGYGLSKPIASNDTEEGRAENRRVELVKMG